MRINPRQIEQAMKKMGIKTEQIDADEVIIREASREIVITNPQVTKVNMGGQDTFQIAGDVSERERGSGTNTDDETAGKEEADASENDVKVVMERTGASEEHARAALEESDGDLVQAIMKLKKK